MSRKSHYLADRAKIHRYVPNYNKRVIDTNEPPTPFGDWIRCRLRPVTGNETPVEEVVPKIVLSYELVLHHHDESGNPVAIEETDEFELKAKLNGDFTHSEDSLKIVGAIQEVRKNNKVVSYVLPVAWEVEQ